MAAFGQRAVERVEKRADLAVAVGAEHAAGVGEQPRAPAAGVGVGARAVEQDGAGLAEGVGEHGRGVERLGRRRAGR